MLAVRSALFLIAALLGWCDGGTKFADILKFTSTPAEIETDRLVLLLSVVFVLLAVCLPDEFVVLS